MIWFFCWSGESRQRRIVPKARIWFGMLQFLCEDPSRSRKQQVKHRRFSIVSHGCFKHRDDDRWT